MSYIIYEKDDGDEPLFILINGKSLQATVAIAETLLENSDSREITIYKAEKLVCLANHEQTPPAAQEQQ